MKGKVENGPINKIAELALPKEEKERLRKEAMKLKPNTLREEVGKLKIGE